MDRVPGYEPGGRRFESFRARHFKTMKFVLIKLLIAVCLISETSISLLSANEHNNLAETPLQPSVIYAKQLQQMISEQDHLIEIYQKQLDEPKITRSELLVLAEQLLDSLQEWIELDLPFLYSERQLRIKGLREMLASSDLDVTEKIRRILEAYRIEAEYGFAFESYRAKLDKEDTVVDFIHIGRNSLIYRSLDGRQMRAWNRYTADWQPLSVKYRYPIKQAFNITHRGTAPKILLLPVQLTQAADHGTSPIEQPSERKTILAQTQQEPTDLNHEAATLEVLLKNKKQQASELRSLYYQSLGTAKGLITVIRNVAEELHAMISESFMPLLLPHYHTSLEPLLQNNQSLEIAHIKTLQALFIELYSAQAETNFFTTKLISENGTLMEREIIHIGPFTLLYDDKLLSYMPSINHPVMLSKSPNKLLSFASDSITKEDLGNFVKAPVDLSRGAILTTLSASPTTAERIWQAGWIAYLILALGAYGLMLIVFKICLLWQCLSSVRTQKNDTKYDFGNPLGRILSIAERRNASIEEIEWAIEQAVLGEIPRLEWGFSTIKVFIIAAPLLGLLGTVLGMMETFQAITLFGTNDPKIMAQGISQALTTTMLGLCVAILLLLLYTWAMSYNKEIRNILEQQSAGLLIKQINKITR